MKLLLLLLALPMIGFGQNVNIPDAIFKEYLVNNTAINTNGDYEIQVSEASVFNGGIYLYAGPGSGSCLMCGIRGARRIGGGRGRWPGRRGECAAGAVHVSPFAVGAAAGTDPRNRRGHRGDAGHGPDGKPGRGGSSPAGSAAAGDVRNLRCER